MAFTPDPETFNPAKRVVALKGFRACGRQFVAGDDFPWRKMAMTERRVRQMFDARRLGHAKDVEDEALNDLAESNAYWEPEAVGYNLDEISDMKELRRIAYELGAPYKVSKADQRDAIRDHLNKETD